MKSFILEHHTGLKKCKETIPHKPEIRIVFKTLKEAVVYARTIKPENSYINWRFSPRYIVNEREELVRCKKTKEDV